MSLCCPTCKKRIHGSGRKELKSKNLLPFCSEKCKLIDLGAWLDAEYRITSTKDENNEGIELSNSN